MIYLYGPSLYSRRKVLIVNGARKKCSEWRCYDPHQKVNTVVICVCLPTCWDQIGPLHACRFTAEGIKRRVKSKGRSVKSIHSCNLFLLQRHVITEYAFPTYISFFFYSLLISHCNVLSVPGTILQRREKCFLASASFLHVYVHWPQFQNSGAVVSGVGRCIVPRREKILCIPSILL
jgi:hypothetical protein